jgi:hypothetical protein
MKNLYKKYEEGGIGGVKKDPPPSLAERMMRGFGDAMTMGQFGPLKSLVEKYGPQAMDMIEDLMGQSEMDEALEEFNEKADRMPTGRSDSMRPGREDLRNLPAPEEMRSRQARYVPGGSDYKPFVKMISYEEDRKLNDTVGDRKMIGRTNPNVGEGINPRRRLFRRR